MFFCSNLFAQDISGSWSWKYGDSKHISQITLEESQTGNFHGNYCSAFYQGSKIDCSQNETEFCIDFVEVSQNIYEGTFTSPSFNGSGQLRITYLSNPTEGLKVEVLSSNGEFYLPDDVIFK